MEFLKRGFEYDLWANKQWLDCLLRTSVGDPDLLIFQHILSSQVTWALRCEGEPPSEPPTPELTHASIEEINAKWMKLLESMDPEEFISYHRFTGEGGKMKFSWMAQHVINHATYHRGELRGLRRMRNDNDFPDTDIAGYASPVGGAEAV